MPKNYVYNDLSALDALTMDVEGVGTFEVVQFSSSWAANEVPTASVMLAVGRNARTDKYATIHTAGKKLKQMQKAVVWFNPRGEFNRGVPWPAGGRRKVFDGYFTGIANRKVSGKIVIVANLIHWLAALGFSSALNKNAHVANPTELNAAAVLQSLVTPGAAAACNVSSAVPSQLVAEAVQQDLWSGIKTVFAAFAGVEALAPAGVDEECGGTGAATTNDAALEALARIEGPIVTSTLGFTVPNSASVPYKWGTRLVVDNMGVPLVEDAVSAAVGNEMIESYSAVSFWDKLVGQFCPMFGMAVVPMVNSAIVAADCPAYNGDVWRDVQVDDYDSFDLSRELHRPLRAVGVVAGYASQTQVAVNAIPADGNAGIAIGGCYVEDSVAAGDGTILYVSPPPWLQVLSTLPGPVTNTQGLGSGAPGPTATTPGRLPPAKGVPSDSAVATSVNRLYTRYAQMVYVNQMLRGQAGSFSGKLRFDIAPLSLVRCVATTEKFVGDGQDDLAEPIVGCVQRVTISINAEAGLAGTTYALSHVRTSEENRLPRTSVTEHPLFGKSIHGGGTHGCPLVDDWAFPGPLPVAPPPREV